MTDVNTTSAISVVTSFDSSNYYVTFKFEQIDTVFEYENSEYYNLADFLENNSATYDMSKDDTFPCTNYFKLVKNNLPRYATVTCYVENGVLKAQPVQYSNTPFA